MALAKNEAGNTPSEFAGLPGLYGNLDPVLVPLETKKLTGTAYPEVEAVAPHQARMAAMQTDSTNADSAPAYGEAKKVS